MSRSRISMGVKAGYDPSRNKRPDPGDEIAYRMLYRVLLVEDDIDDQFFARIELKRLKRVSKVICFSNGRELLKFLKIEQEKENCTFIPPTIIVMDINMPLMNGYETLKHLKQLKNIERIPIIMMTSEYAQWQVNKILSLMPVTVLKKPFCADKLLRIFGEEEHHSFWESIWH